MVALEIIGTKVAELQHSSLVVFSFAHLSINNINLFIKNEVHKIIQAKVLQSVLQLESKKKHYN